MNKYLNLIIRIILLFFLFSVLTSCNKINKDIYLASWYNIEKRNYVCTIETNDYTFNLPDLNCVFIKNYDKPLKIDYEIKNMSIIREYEFYDIQYFYLNNNYYGILNYKCYDNNVTNISLIATELNYNFKNINYSLYLPINMIAYFDFENLYSMSVRQLNDYFSTNSFKLIKPFFEKYSSGVTIDEQLETIFFNCSDKKDINLKFDIALDYKNKQIKLKEPGSDEYTVLNNR